jgi:hypothetical protein
MTPRYCEKCGKEHADTDRQIGFGKPDAYFEVPDSERESRVFVHSDICDIDRKRFFVRGLLQIPVHGHEPFGWGIWAEMGKPDFIRYVELYNSHTQANEAPLHGRIATLIPAYPAPTIGIPVAVELTGPTTRPIFLIDPAVNHPLAEEQRSGVLVDRLSDFFASIEKQTSPPVRSQPVDSGAVHCDIHGIQQETFVCQHIAQGVVTKKRVGFFWTSHDPHNRRPDAWCQACQERLRATDGEWVGETEAHLDPKVLCGACYDLAKKFHMGEDPWS